MILNNLYFTILDLYPNINTNDFMLVDHGDGLGPRIHSWNSSYPLPSQEELEAQHIITTLNRAKITKIEKIKKEAYDQIVSILDETKQRNYLAASLEIVNKKVDGVLLSQQEIDFLNNTRSIWENQINVIRTNSNAREAVVNNATTLLEIEEA